MRQQSSFAGWDFNTVWAIDPSINNGYPYLKNLVANLTETSNPPVTTKDSEPSSWAKADVDRADELGLFPDSLKGKYQKNITRAEFCELAVKLYEAIKGKFVRDTTLLHDMSSGETLMPTISKKAIIKFKDTDNENILKMAYLEVVTGDGKGNFNPNNEITRQEAAVMLGRLMEALDCYIPLKNPDFKDVDSVRNWWSYEYIGKLQSLNIMNGVNTNVMIGNTFEPLGKYTREQSIVTLMRIWDLVKGISASWIAPLTQEEYKTAFSDKGNEYNWRFAYWSALVSNDTYNTDNDKTSNAMKELGFKDIEIVKFNNDEIKAVYGVKELETEIRGKKKIIWVSFRGTYYGDDGKDYRNIASDIFEAFVPKNWYEQPNESTLYTVHYGFFKYVNQFIEHDLSGNNVFNYGNMGWFPSFDDCLFIITGHSLGGAMAELYALRLYELGRNKGLSKNDIICYGVASPPNSNKPMADYCIKELEMGARIHKLYHDHDATPYAGVKGTVFSLAKDADNAENHFGKTSGEVLRFTKYHSIPTAYLPYIMQHLIK